MMAAADPSSSSAMMETSSTTTPPRLDSQKLIGNYDETVSLIKQLFLQLADVKKSPSGSMTEKKAKISPLLQKIIVLFSELRLHNREIYLDIEQRRGVSSKLRSTLDARISVVQSHQYELQYLLREIHNTRDFKSREREIALISEEEYEKVAPAELKVSKASTPHLYEVNRLNFELQSRKNLVAKLNELKMRKKALLEANASKLKYLDGLVTKLKSLTKAAAPIQSYLALPTTKLRTLHQFSVLLPSSLYNLLQLALSYKEAFGDAELDVDLKTAIDIETLKPGAPLPPAISSAIDHPKKLSEIDPKKASLDAYKAHPIGLQLEIKSSAATNAPMITLLFQYLVHLGLVTVTIQGAGADHNLLINLFVNDAGIDVPSSLHFKYADGSEFHFSSAQLGRPYKWAQSLCGLLFLENVSSSSSTTQMVTPTQLRINFKNVVRAIRNRLRARAALTSQLDMLARFMIPSAPNSKEPAASSGSPAAFTAWKKLNSPTEFDGIEWPPVKLGVPASPPLPAWAVYGSQYYRATFTRADETVELFLEVPANYPERAPHMKVRFSSKQFPPFTTSASASKEKAGGAVKEEKKEKEKEAEAHNAVKKEESEIPQPLENAYRKLMASVAEAEKESQSAIAETDKDFLLSNMVRKFRSSWVSKLAE